VVLYSSPAAADAVFVRSFRSRVALALALALPDAVFVLYRQHGPRLSRPG